MKSMLALSVILSASAVSAQVPYPSFYSYAPGFSYSSFGTPASTTKLNPVAPQAVVAAPTTFYTHHTPYFHHAPAPYFHAAPAPFFNPYFYGGGAPFPFYTQQPAVIAAQQPEKAAETTPYVASEVTPLADDVDVVTVTSEDEPAVNAASDFTLRRIFPVFGASGLRGASNHVVFARPDQVEVTDNSSDEDKDYVVISPEVNLRSFSPYQGAPVLPYAALPAGIAQASQPRFGGSPFKVVEA